MLTRENEDIGALHLEFKRFEDRKNIPSSASGYNGNRGVLVRESHTRVYLLRIYLRLARRPQQENGPSREGATKVDSVLPRSVNKLVFDTRRCFRLPPVRPVFYPRLPRKPLTNGSQRPPRSATSRLDISELGQPNDVLSNAPFHQAVRVPRGGQVKKKKKKEKNNTPSPPSVIHSTVQYSIGSPTLRQFVYLFARLRTGSLT